MPANPRRAIMLNNIPVASIRRILDYLHEEQENYESNPVDNHIYRNIHAVEQWIKSLPGSSS
jgi:hypothetical protein